MLFRFTKMVLNRQISIISALCEISKVNLPFWNPKTRWFWWHLNAKMGLLLVNARFDNVKTWFLLWIQRFRSEKYTKTESIYLVLMVSSVRIRKLSDFSNFLWQNDQFLQNTLTVQTNTVHKTSRRASTSNNSLQETWKWSIINTELI